MKFPFASVFSLLLGVLLAAGCAGAGEPPADYAALARESLGREYAFSASFAYGGETAEARVEKTGEADLRLEFTAPELLEGLVVSAAGEEVRVEYRGAEVDLSAYDLPTQSILFLLREVLTGGGELSVTEGEETVTLSGASVVASYELDFDRETMELREIRIPSVDGVVAVSDFAFLDEGGGE